MDLLTDLILNIYHLQCERGSSNSVRRKLSGHLRRVGGTQGGEYRPEKGAGATADATFGKHCGLTTVIEKD